METSSRCEHCAHPLGVEDEYCRECGAVIAWNVKPPASTAETVKQFVVVHEPGGLVRKVFLKHEKTRIGRAKQCEIILNHPRVSRHHATIVCVEDRATIKDHRSANGTFVNDRPIHDSIVELQPGDTCRLGRLPDDCVTMVFHRIDE